MVCPIQYQNRVTMDFEYRPTNCNKLLILKKSQKVILNPSSQMTVKKSSEVYGVSMKVLKSCSSEFIEPLIQTINKSLRTDIFPKDGKQAKVGT